MREYYKFFFFFFQAEDGIRDKLVTGVQTCALPIWPTTTPAAANAPSMPIVMPRTIRFCPANFQPSQIDFATDGTEIPSSPLRRLGSSCSEYTVSAEITNVATLKYSESTTWPWATCWK